MPWRDLLNSCSTLVHFDPRLDLERTSERAIVQMSTLVVSAPGKVIIHGEHAVVYGKVSIEDLTREHDSCRSLNLSSAAIVL